MLKLAMMLPLLMMEMNLESEEEEDHFLTLFSQIRDTLMEVRDRLPEPPNPDELNLVPDQNETDPDPDPIGEPAKIEVEAQPPIVTKKVPWGRKSQ